MQRRGGGREKGKKSDSASLKGRLNRKGEYNLQQAAAAAAVSPALAMLFSHFTTDTSPHFSANCKYARELQKSCLKMGQAEAMHFSVVIDPALRQSQFGYVTQPTCHYLALA